MTLALWTLTAAAPEQMARVAERAEAAGWHGLALVDSQNLSGDCYVNLTAAALATTRLHLGPGVTNPATRHPAVTASAVASLQRVSRGRAVLGIGRGDSALAHLGRAPTRVRAFERHLVALQTYLRGEGVSFDELDFDEQVAPAVTQLGLAATVGESRLHWLGKHDRKVPVEVAATGPRVIGIAACHADRVLLAVGADPERLRWGMDCARRARTRAGLDPAATRFGAFVNLACHADVDVARHLVSGGLATFARFAAMDGRITGQVSTTQRRVLERVHAAYDMRHHTAVGAPQTAPLTPDFIDHYAIVGTPRHCIDRLCELERLGVEKVIVVGPTPGVDPDAARASARILTSEVLAEFR